MRTGPSGSKVILQEQSSSDRGRRFRWTRWPFRKYMGNGPELRLENAGGVTQNTADFHRRGKRGKTWTEFPLILAAGPVASGPRSSSKREIHRAVVVAHRGCRYLALERRPHPAWLGAQRGDWAMAARNLARTRCGGSGRGCRIGRVASRQGACPPTRPRDRRSSPARGARGWLPKSADALPQARREACGGRRWARRPAPAVKTTAGRCARAPHD